MRITALLPAGERARPIRFGIARGARMSIDFHRGQTRLYLGLYECELNRTIRRLAPHGTPSFDLGGEYGYDALALARLTGAPVVSVECVPELCETIRSNAALNPRLAPLITVRQAFIGAGAGQLSLDELTQSTFVPGFVKMDIEGGEVEALEGATDLLRAGRPSLLVEVHGKAAEVACLAILRAASYDVKTVDTRSWLPDHRPIDHNRWLVAVPGR
ncbi:MAG TPA: FkbM family methyltransferase [Acidimicrobiales bacterium]|nr:FkbM family methyltransferase [Acidimicrobiales bacterium]